MRILKWALGSRKVWVAIGTVAAAAICKSLGLPEEVAADLANLIAVIGLALIAAIAGEDIAKKLNGGKK